MRTNRLRMQAESCLALARKAQDDGRAADAHAFTLKAAEYLEQAVNIEELRRRASLSASAQNA
jgi:hypothetical protein